MKSILRRITALALCAVLLCSTALASDALGGKIYGYTLDICDDTTLTREVMWSSSRSDLRTENYVTYKPSDSISPVVSFGSSIPDNCRDGFFRIEGGTPVKIPLSNRLLACCGYVKPGDRVADVGCDHGYLGI